MNDQINVFGEDVSSKRSVSAEQKAKRNFLARFQRWCDKEADDETTATGMCGWGDPCDYCADSSVKSPCAKALNAMIKETGIQIDYETADPSDFW